eukprot:6422058-Prorocentrum_lima.AAC.1
MHQLAMYLLLLGWPPPETMRSMVVSGLGGSTQPPDPLPPVSSLPTAPPQSPPGLLAEHSDGQQPLVFVTFNVTSLAGELPQSEWRTQLLSEAFARAEVDIACIQEARWRTSGVTIIGPYT